MGNAEATPRPWKWINEDADGEPFELVSGADTVLEIGQTLAPWPPNIADAELIVRAVNAHDALVEALELVRGIISDAALTGFNCEDGDWADRLFASQGNTYAALCLARHGPPQKEAA